MHSAPTAANLNGLTRAERIARMKAEAAAWRQYAADLRKLTASLEK
jgi:hypothetical protein